MLPALVLNSLLVQRPKCQKFRFYCLINDLKSVKRISFLCSFRFTDDEVRMLRANDIWHIIQSEHRHKRFKYGIVAHMVTVERIEALTRNMPLNDSMTIMNKFLWCNCNTVNKPIQYIK